MNNLRWIGAGAALALALGIGAAASADGSPAPLGTHEKVANVTVTASDVQPLVTRAMSLIDSLRNLPGSVPVNLHTQQRIDRETRMAQRNLASVSTLLATKSDPVSMKTANKLAQQSVNRLQAAYDKTIQGGK